ncbi:MAG: hypothetical protein KGJ59_04420 [Bacteroidota bacterium]|nr:hypothetical protein [Bacteroidota bacterium]
MEKRITKISVLLLIVSAIVWLGAVNVRAIIGYELLQPRALEFLPNLDKEFEREIFHLLSYSSLLIIGAYVVTFFSAVVFLSTTSLKLKMNGWLLMSAILFFMFSPVEFYTLYLDGRMAFLELLTTPDMMELRRLFLHRVAALAGVPLIALLSYYTIVALAVWKPLTKVDPLQ